MALIGLKIAIIFLSTINRLVILMEMQCVYSEVGTEFFMNYLHLFIVHMLKLLLPQWCLCRIAFLSTKYKIHCDN
jgi:hypothetical protein